MADQADSGKYEELSWLVVPHTLVFRRPAKTSRNTMNQHRVWYVGVFHRDKKDTIGWGEVAPIPGLSSETEDDVIKQLNALESGHAASLLRAPETMCSSIRFAIETALADWESGGNKKWQTALNASTAIPINGLVWMNTYETMRDEAFEKINAGFTTLKLKIGGIDFNDECKILAEIRSSFSPNQLTIRLDANGAFHPDEAVGKLTALSEFAIHSLEQPIKAGQPAAMRKVIEKSPIPIALDEELIGLKNGEEKEILLRTVNPAYIVLKPSLHGGMQGCDEWIACAQAQQIQWWATSALESNIGLNAIAQWTLNHRVQLPQGLGTGLLYTNNIASPWYIEGDVLRWKSETPWGSIPHSA
jgi:o-succinylbenzoate synthase